MDFCVLSMHSLSPFSPPADPSFPPWTLTRTEEAEQALSGKAPQPYLCLLPLICLSHSTCPHLPPSPCYWGSSGRSSSYYPLISLKSINSRWVRTSLHAYNSAFVGGSYLQLTHDALSLQFMPQKGINSNLNLTEREWHNIELMLFHSKQNKPFWFLYAWESLTKKKSQKLWFF